MANDILHSLEEKLNPKWTALLVIDYQNDFVAEGGAFDKAGFDPRPLNKIAPRLGGFVREVRQRGVPVIFIKCEYNASDNRYLSDAFLSQVRRTLNGIYIDIPLCVKDAWGSEIYEGVEEAPEDIEVIKHRFDAFIDTDLDLILRSKSIRTVIATGVGTHVCVESTVRHAFFNDYYNVVPRDCVATYDPEFHRNSLKAMDMLYGQVVDSQEILDALDGHLSRERVAAGDGRSRQGE